MKRRIFAAFAAAGVVLALRGEASAVGMGSLTLQLAKDTAPVSDAAVAVYRVGTAAVGGYRLTEDFGGGFISEADVFYPELIGWLAGKPEDRLCAGIPTGRAWRVLTLWRKGCTWWCRKAGQGRRGPLTPLS